MDMDARLIPPHRINLCYSWKVYTVFHAFIFLCWNTNSYSVSGYGGDIADLLPRSSKSDVCHTRCSAKCEDIVDGIPPFRWGIPQELLDEDIPPIESLLSDSDECKNYYCSIFEIDDWMLHCDGNPECLENCVYITNQTVDLEIQPPGVPSGISIEQGKLYSVKISWQPAQNHSRHSVMYLVQRRPLDVILNWTTVNSTMEPEMTVALGVCEHTEFRIAAVNQYGTQGFSQHFTRIDLPSPGIIDVVSSQTVLENGYLIYSLDFYPPQGWVPSDISRYLIHEPIEPYCVLSVYPPYPLPPGITKEPNDKLELSIKFHETAYGCCYFTNIRAVTQCGTIGSGYNITADFTDCESIENFACPTRGYAPPSKVQNVTADVSDFPEVLFTWEPPLYEGTEGILGYAIQWGPLLFSFPIPEMTIEGLAWTWKNVTETLVQVLEESSPYGVKVVAVDITGMDRANDTFKIMQPFQFETPDAPQGTTSEPGDSGPDSAEISHERFLPLYIILPIAGLAAVIVVTLLSIRRRKQPKRSDEPFAITDSSSGDSQTVMLRNKVESWMVKNPLYERRDPTVPLVEPDEWEVPQENLTLGEVLGRGAFGQVTKGVLKLTGLKLPNPQIQREALEKNSEEVVVAVKMLHEYAGDSQRQDFLNEMDLMKKIGYHGNIISIVGCCTQRELLLLIVEHVTNGDLLHYLRKHRHRIWETSSIPEMHLTFHDLLSFARQIAAGMEFLAQRGFVHRDLATRNVMVGENKTVKIGDFGLTRYIYNDRLYVAGKGARLPLKWMAIESIEEYRFNTETDVWSFGVVLFELVTLGGTPYPTFHNKHLLRELKAGYRMEKPDNCTPQLYEMMLNCWSRNPNERSTFTELRNKLTEMIAEMVPNNYLNLFLDETRDYYQIETSSTGSSEDDEAPQLEGQGSICPSRGQSSNRGPRTVSESTKGGDSGVGDKSSTSTSHVTLHSSNQSFDACGGSSSSVNVFNPPTSQPLTSTSWFHNKIFDMEASNLSVCAAVTTKPEEISTKVKRSPEKNGSHNFSASFPILVRLQKPYSGNHQRTSTSSMEQLIPGQSLSGETLDSGSHSWIAGQTSV